MPVVKDSMFKVGDKVVFVRNDVGSLSDKYCSIGSTYTIKRVLEDMLILSEEPCPVFYDEVVPEED